MLKEKQKETGLIILSAIIFGFILLGLTLWGVKNSHAQEQSTESIPVDIKPIITEKVIALPETNELIELRTEKTQTFQNNDGTKTLRIYQNPIFTIDYQNDTWLKDEIISLFGKNVYALTATTSDGKDSYIASNVPTTNFGSLTYMDCQTGTHTFNCLMSFTTPDLTGYTVVSASIKTTEADGRASDNNGSLYLNIHELSANTDWIESEVTYNKAKSTTNWNTAGGDYKATPINYIIPTATNLSVSTFLIYGTGTPNPLSTISGSTTYHFMLRYASSSTDELYTIHSDEVTTVAYRPYMEITYTESPPEEPLISTDSVELLQELVRTGNGTNFMLSWLIFFASAGFILTLIYKH